MKSIWSIVKPIIMPWNLPWLLLTILLGYATGHYYVEYSAYRQKEIRKVVLLDTWSEMRGSKHSVHEEFMGYFRDDLSGAGFEYPVSGGLHKSFSKTLKAMPLDVRLSPRDVGNEGKKDWMMFAFLLYGIGFLVSIVVRIGVWGDSIKQKSYEKHSKK
jgi:hypothetical protein